MEIAKERAKEFGRNILSMATGSSAEGDREKVTSKRQSWSDVVSSSPPASTASPAKSSKVGRVEAGMPKPSSTSYKKIGGGSSPRRGSSTQKIFSAEDVARLVEIARNQLRKEKESISGWKEVEHREARSKEKTYAHELVEGFRGSSDAQFRCWQCDQPDHKSSDCPKGEHCFVCNSHGHKLVDRPSRRKATREEKGKALDLGSGHNRQVIKTGRLLAQWGGGRVTSPTSTTR